MRRLAVVLTLLAAWAPAPARALPPACEWPMYGHDLGHSFAPGPRSFATECTPLNPLTAPALRPRWLLPTADSVTASPTVVDGTVYVGAWDGTFYALDASTGAVRWTFQVEDTHRVAFGRIVSSAAVDTMDGVPVVLFGGGATLYALDPATGALLAAADTDPRPQVPDPDPAQVEIESSPAVAHFPWGDVAFVGMDVHNGRGVGRTGLLAFQLVPRAGQPPYELRLRWKFDPERGLVLHDLKDRDGSPGFGCGGVWSSPAVDVELELVFFGTSNCEHPQDSAAAGEVGREAVFALRAATGEEVWRFAPRGPNALDDDFGASPNLLPGGLVGVGGKDGWYYGLDRATGALRYAARAGEAGHVTEHFAVGGIIGTPAVGWRFTGAGCVPGQCGVDQAAVETVFATTAISTPFAEPLDSGQPPVRPEAADPTRFFSLHAIDARTGEVVWRSPATRQSYGAPTYANDVLLVPSTFDLTLKAIWAHNGALLGTVPLPGAPSSAPAIVGDMVFLGVGTRETDLEFKAFGDQLAAAVRGVLGEHPLSRLSGVLALGVG